MAGTGFNEPPNRKLLLPPPPPPPSLLRPPPLASFLPRLFLPILSFSSSSSPRASLLVTRSFLLLLLLFFFVFFSFFFVFFFFLLLLLSFFFFFCWRCYRPPSSDVDTVVVRATYLRFLLLPSFSLLFPLPPCWFVLFLSLSLYRSRDSLTWNYALVAREYEIRRSSHARRAYNEGTNQKQEPSV